MDRQQLSYDQPHFGDVPAESCTIYIYDSIGLLDSLAFEVEHKLGSIDGLLQVPAVSISWLVSYQVWMFL